MIPISAHLETNALCFAHVCLCRIHSTCRSSLDREERESSQPLFHQCMRKELLAASVSSSCLSLYIYTSFKILLLPSNFLPLHLHFPSLISITNHCSLVYGLLFNIIFLPQLCALPAAGLTVCLSIPHCVHTTSLHYLLPSDYPVCNDLPPFVSNVQVKKMPHS